MTLGNTLLQGLEILPQLLQVTIVRQSHIVILHILLPVTKQSTTITDGIILNYIQSVERAGSQAHQIAIVTAGLMASSILVRLSLADVKAGKIKFFTSTV